MWSRSSGFDEERVGHIGTGADAVARRLVGDERVEDEARVAHVHARRASRAREEDGGAVRLDADDALSVSAGFAVEVAQERVADGASEVATKGEAQRSSASFEVSAVSEFSRRMSAQRARASNVSARRVPTTPTRKHASITRRRGTPESEASWMRSRVGRDIEP